MVRRDLQDRLDRLGLQADHRQDLRGGRLLVRRDLQDRRLLGRRGLQVDRQESLEAVLAHPSCPGCSADRLSCQLYTYRNIHEGLDP